MLPSISTIFPYVTNIVSMDTALGPEMRLWETEEEQEAGGGRLEEEVEEEEEKED